VNEKISELENYKKDMINKNEIIESLNLNYNKLNKEYNKKSEYIENLNAKNKNKVNLLNFSTNKI